MGAIGNVGVLLVQTLGGLYLLAILLRFLLQIARADFYNPFTQAIVKVTDPAVRIFRRFVPGYRGVDFASLVLALLLQCVFTTLLMILEGERISGLGQVITWSVLGLLSFVLNIYFWSMIVSIIASFIAPYSAHPALSLIRQLTEPRRAPFRRLLPSMGGLDLSPIFVFLALQIIRTVLIMPAGVNPTVVLGI
ncbi:MAG: YggT family protein [Pseudohongiellaceae bacterium]